MYTEGQNLDEILTSPNISEQRKQNVFRQISEIMTMLHKNRITHGDFKRTNFIITDYKVYITDLDAMKLHRCRLSFKRRKTKDTSRLERMFQ